MASLATIRTTLSPWLRLLPWRHDGLLLSRTSASTELSKNYFHSIRDQPRTFTQSFEAFLPQTQTKSCIRFQTHNVSSVPLKVPQVDLDSEVKTDRSREGKIGAESASKVLQNLSPEQTRKLKIIKLEFDVTEQMYGKVPKEMTDENWLHALGLENKSQRLRYYSFLWKIENIKRSKKKKQEVKHLLRAETPPEEVQLRSANSIFFIIREAAMKKAGNYRLAHAMQFGQRLVFDMDYEEYMRHQDCQNLVFQLLLSYSKNREARYPFHFIFTSLQPRGRVFQMLRRAHLVGSQFLGTMTSQSYLDLFPRERLVYLSPHASKSLKELRADDVYIVGGIVDKTVTKPLSLARAKEQGIRVAKFPLDDYLLWGQGSKSLTLDQVTTILLEQKRSRDWNEAFKAIPRRKLYRDDS